MCVWVIICMGVMCAAVGIRPAWAMDDASNAGVSNAASVDTTTSQKGVSLRIEDNTSTTINGKDDYTAVISVTNNTGRKLTAGNVRILTDPNFSFDSSELMQAWADKNYDDISPVLRWMDVSLGSTKVDALDVGATKTVIVHSSADSDAMQQFTSWGPKPLNIIYTEGSDDTELASVHSFVTRTRDGLSSHATPNLNVVIAMPLTTSQWKTSDTAVSRLLTHADADTAASRATVTSISDDAASGQEALAGVLRKHRSIQVIGDPGYLQTFDTKPTVAAIMQPYGFDLAYQAQTASQYDWKSAGLTPSRWNASSGADLYRTAIGNDKADAPTAIAWQSRAAWTTESLAAARQQGYSAVVAESGYDPDTPDAVHTSKMVVPTSAGDITVLNTQKELSTLAQGNATSTDATAENTESGRLARFVAQSAFYQREAPYESRTLLVSLGQSPNTASVDTLVSKLESCSWLKLDGLASLLKAQPYVSSAQAEQRSKAVKKLGGSDAEEFATHIKSLTSSQAGIRRFAASVVVTDRPNADGNANNNDRTNTAEHWMQSVENAYRDLAIKSFSSFTVQNSIMTRAARQLNNGLYAGISVAQPDSINIVSQSAKMPITIANDHPYPVHIRFTARTTSEQITASADDTDVVVLPHAEVQSTVNVHILSSGSANVIIQLQDRDGRTFGTSTSAHVTSVLQINDWSGYAILALAFLLGAFGLWRQFHRIKDPDE
ncbi:hypothetical protein KIH77_07955 [Bifidobacterium sp. 82T24]|uniref:DUF6049 family protein n=1 Tax=Bifidobacterium pluvialisilvae TaxID=2834436 RepID=UPI001C58580B|nr:DUF6049 family protein [Bifidobacterium pluvialisilvae]MBW3088659.1 hypothetical protein [Bifidobacterium pluvialisilvae]